MYARPCRQDTSAARFRSTETGAHPEWHVYDAKKTTYLWAPYAAEWAVFWHDRLTHRSAANAKSPAAAVGAAPTATDTATAATATATTADADATDAAGAATDAAAAKRAAALAAAPAPRARPLFAAYVSAACKEHRSQFFNALVRAAEDAAGPGMCQPRHRMKK